MTVRLRSPGVHGAAVLLPALLTAAVGSWIAWASWRNLHSEWNGLTVLIVGAAWLVWAIGLTVTTLVASRVLSRPDAERVIAWLGLSIAILSGVVAASYYVTLIVEAL
ncbi:MAG: hypothetical protein AB7K08_13160 [Microbacteriaceae bacterium]